MSVLRYCIPSGADILLNFTHTMDIFAEWKAADSENNFLYHLFRFLYYNHEFKMHNNFKQAKSERTGQSPLKGTSPLRLNFQRAWSSLKEYDLQQNKHENKANDSTIKFILIL